MKFKDVKIGNIVKTMGTFGGYYLKLNNNFSHNSVSLERFSVGTIAEFFELEDLGEIKINERN